MKGSQSLSSSPLPDDPPDDVRLEFLTIEQVRRIDQLLAVVGEYGEIHLIVQRGELRFINKVESFKAPSDHAK